MTILNILTQGALPTIAQNNAASLSIETGLKAVGRPAFTLADKHADKDSKKFSASKELLYQLLCLGIYLGAVVPVFRKATYKVMKNILKDAKFTVKNKDEITKVVTNKDVVVKAADFEKFKGAAEYLDFHKLASIEDV